MWRFTKRLESIAIDNDKARWRLQLFQCQVHGFDGSIQDIDLVNLLYIHTGHGPADGSRLDGFP